jgi:hypothetical protein
MSIAKAELEVKSAVDVVLACSQISAGSPSRLADVEAQLWTALLALGRAVIGLFLARCAARPRPGTYSHNGQRFALDCSYRRSIEIGTRFGKQPFSRPVGLPLGGASRAVDLPVDRELGLCSGFSLGTVMSVTRLCAMMAFATARTVFKQFHEWMPSQRAVLRMVDAIGAQARPFLEQDPAPVDDGEILVIEADGGGAPMIGSKEYQRRSKPKRKRKRTETQRHHRRNRRREHPKRRRTKGKKSKNSKLAVVGAIYTLRKTPRGLEGPINKRLIATFTSHAELFGWLDLEAKKRGYGKKRTVFLADGSEHIWSLQQKHFPSAEVCLDWIHVTEKLWTAGQCVFAEGSDELAQWVAEQQALLRRGWVDRMLQNLNGAFLGIAKTGPGNKGRRERLGEVIDYLTGHHCRLRYHALRRDDLPIGTGVIEGAIRNLIRVRLDGPGMRWSRDRAEHVLHLRCILLNGQWDAFTRFIAARSVRLASQPTPTRTHDAKSQQFSEAA